MKNYKQNYFIEFRMYGYAKKYLKSLIWNVAKKFRVKGVTSKKPVPHITLTRPPFKTKYSRKLVKTVKEVCSRYQLVPFKIKGFNYFKKPKKVIYVDIEPSKELRRLQTELSKEINKIADIKEKLERGRKFKFHATIAFKDIDRKFKKIWRYIKSKEEPLISQNLLRVTIINRGRIFREYDLILQRLLTRRQALSKKLFKRTINTLKELREK